MSTEERLSAALHEQADGIDVDVARLHAATRSRLPRSRSPRHGVWLRPAVAVVAVLAVVAGVAAVVRGGDDPRGVAPAGTIKAGGVASAFTCPGQVVVDDKGREVDDSFLPSLARGPRAAADAAGAPRYSYVRQRDKATLRLGNADGSLASTSGFERVGDAWELRTTTKCAGMDHGILVPVRDPLRLGARHTDPYPSKGLTDGSDLAVMVDDREYYDVSGLVQHRTMWAYPCEKVFCVSAGRPDAKIIWTGEHPKRPVPEDLSQVFLPPDEATNMRNPYGFWAVYDPQGTVRDVRTSSSSGAGAAAVQVAGPDWPGRLYLLLQPWDEVDAIAVRTAAGTKTYPKAGITGAGSGAVTH